MIQAKTVVVFHDPILSLTYYIQSISNPVGPTFKMSRLWLSHPQLQRSGQDRVNSRQDSRSRLLSGLSASTLHHSFLPIIQQPKQHSPKGGKSEPHIR